MRLFVRARCEFWGLLPPPDRRQIIARAAAGLSRTDGKWIAQILQQAGRGALLADVQAHALGTVRGFREWAQVEADDGFFQPAARAGDDFVVIDEQLPQLVPIRFRVS